MSLRRFNTCKQTKRYAFTSEEDEKLKKLVETCGKYLDWRSIAFDMKGRTPRQCRDRYNNYLKTDIQLDHWKVEEDQFILNQVENIGTKWQRIASMMSGRTANSVRNRYFNLFRKNNSIIRAHTLKSEKEDASNMDNSLESFMMNPLFQFDLEIPCDSIFFNC